MDNDAPEVIAYLATQLKRRDDQVNAIFSVANEQTRELNELRVRVEEWRKAYESKQEALIAMTYERDNLTRLNTTLRFEIDNLNELLNPTKEDDYDETETD